MIDTIYTKMVNINWAAPIGFKVSVIKITPLFKVIFGTQHESAVQPQYQFLIF